MWEAAGLGGCGSRRQKEQWEQEAGAAGGTRRGKGRHRKWEVVVVGGSRSGRQQEREIAGAGDICRGGSGRVWHQKFANRNS